MRHLAITAFAAATLCLGACAGTGDPVAQPSATSTSRAPLGKAEACVEFAKARPLAKPEEPFTIALNQLIQAGNDKTKVKEASLSLADAWRGIRGKFEAIAASTTDETVKAGLTDAVAAIKTAESDLAKADGDQAKAMAVMDKVNLRAIDDMCK
jgi:hypothetical protein